ncbi:MAG: phospholipid carrier-dependent glycosyltransferase [Leptolyngbya sp.]|nr:phospholipid carrier-dependent glycosyltransferase [Leptolyngbya sp.]
MSPRYPLLWLALVGLSSLSLGLRLWGLGRFNQLIFDEIYYIPFALGYLNHAPAFDAHPPLGKYLIALGLWLGQWPAAQLHWPTVIVEGQPVSLLSGRWMNALLGATLPALVAALAYGLSAGYPASRRLRFTLVAMVFMTLEGLTLVESRLALINLYWLWFGLLGQVFWIWAKGTPGRMAAGIALGAAISGKWNGAAFPLGLLLWEIVQASRSGRWPWRRWGLYLGIIPGLTYTLLWLPHLAMTGESFGAVHRHLWAFHQNPSTHGSAHPYCSAWFTWPLMLRPIAYFYQAPVADSAPASPVTIAIQAMGNPILWWLSTAAVLALGLAWYHHGGGKGPIPRATGAPDGPAPLTVAPATGSSVTESPLALPCAVPSFPVINYLSQWLPWLLVSRCTFLYHALGMVAFSSLALAWLVSGWLGHRHRSRRWWGWTILGLVAVGFLFWLPLFIGWPLSPSALARRWWLPTWI